jgi:hypothetical protein
MILLTEQPLHIVIMGRCDEKVSMEDTTLGCPSLQAQDHT